MTNGEFSPFQIGLCLFACLLKELGSEQAKSRWLHLFDFSPLCVFIGPRHPWSDLWVRVSLMETHCVDLTDVTLADEDNNVAMQVAPPGGQTCN